ncbi:MAG: hypothetical protein KAS57_07825 [Gammaproteobacteria bacterium]|nr:hypothetical protein [Gammaproteobacteria bacterium]
MFNVSDVCCSISIPRRDLIAPSQYAINSRLTRMAMLLCKVKPTSTSADSSICKVISRTS